MQTPSLLAGTVKSVDMDTEGGIESVFINRVFILSRLKEIM